MITLTGNLQDIFGEDVAQGFLAVQLCGFGNQLPRVNGTALVARTSPLNVESDDSGAFSFDLRGNDEITPAGTFYQIQILDDSQNVIQCAAYQFSGGGTQDLSAAAPIDPANMERLMTTQLLYVLGPQAPVVGDGTLQTLASYTLPAKTMLAGKGIRIRACITRATGDSHEGDYTLSFGANAIAVINDEAPAGGGPSYFFDVMVFNKPAVVDEQFLALLAVQKNGVAQMAEMGVDGGLYNVDTAADVVIALTQAIPTVEGRPEEGTLTFFLVELVQ